MSQQKQPLIKLSKASVRFGGVKNPPALVESSFVIHRGDMVALIGPNGAGKSTLLGLLAGQQGATGGSCDYAGPSVAQNVSYVPEEPAYWPHLSVREYLEHIAQSHKVADATQNIIELADNLLVTPWLDQALDTLSKGTRQRVHLAAAILPNPDVLLLDEPTDGLDPLQQEKILQFLAELAKTRAVIISTHQLADLQYFNRVLALKAGKIMVDSTPDELKRQGGGDVAIAYRTMMGNRQFAAKSQAGGKK